MAKGQREISVSEFFAKNRHLLGFDNPAKALLTTVKELVDNALDAADEARIPAEVEVRIDQLAEDRFRVACIDNGPGIVTRHVPNVFGKLLFGSKFHRLKMSRGQQGIGVSAAGMYGLLTTGKPVEVITRTSAKKKAHLFEIAIDTRTNEPKVRERQEIDWELPHGTGVTIELEASYRKGQHSIDAYIHQISLANPHATIRYYPPGRGKGDEPLLYARVTEDLPPETAEIKPHPHGVELGVLIQWLHESKSRNLSGFLTSDFSRVSSRLAQEICKTAGIPPKRKPSSLTRHDAETLHKAIAATKIMAPPTDCIAPIGEELLEKALKALQPADFFTSVTRRPTVYRGNPFLVEVAIAYGGQLGGDDPATVYRFANRVPLQYQQGGCAITKAVTSTDWKKYGLQQPRGGNPIGPLLVLVHIASVWVPFTSESKEAIAHYPEILKEIRLGLQDCGRRLSIHINRRRRQADEEKKRSYIQKYIPHVAIALQEILGFSDRDRERTIESLTDVLERSRKM
jgi:DNA topoisomerase-6 subunit B